MKKEWVQAFVDSTQNVLNTMAFTPLHSHTIKPKENTIQSGDASGVIGLVGKDYVGTMVLSFYAPVILKIASNMFGEEMSEFNDEVLDVIGELTNMISAGAKKHLAGLGIMLEMATPTLIKGESTELKQIFAGDVMTVLCKTEVGEFEIDVALSKK